MSDKRGEKVTIHMDDPRFKVSKHVQEMKGKNHALPKDFVHLEHVNLVRVEHKPKPVITEDLALVTRVLELMFFDVNPELLYHLRAR